jgi:hypothetical protein
LILVRDMSSLLENEQERESMFKRCCSLLALCIVVGPTAAFAVPMQVNYTLQISSTVGGFPAGTTVLGHATYDSDVFDPSGYYPLQTHDVVIDGVTHSQAPSPIVGTGASITFQDDVTDRVVLGSSFDFEYIPGISILAIALVLEGPGTLFSGSGAVPVNPADYFSRIGLIAFSHESSCELCVVEGALAVSDVSFEPVTVSEPNVIAFLGFGLFGIGYLYRRRRAL